MIMCFVLGIFVHTSYGGTSTPSFIFPSCRWAHVVRTTDYLWLSLTLCTCSCRNQWTVQYFIFLFQSPWATITIILMIWATNMWIRKQIKNKKTQFCKIYSYTQREIYNVYNTAISNNIHFNLLISTCSLWRCCSTTAFPMIAPCVGVIKVLGDGKRLRSLLMLCVSLSKPHQSSFSNIILIDVTCCRFPAWNCIPVLVW